MLSNWTKRFVNSINVLNLKPMCFSLRIISWIAAFIANDQCWHSRVLCCRNSRSTFFKRKLYQTIPPLYNGITADTRVGICCSASDQGSFSQPVCQNKGEKLGILLMLHSYMNMYSPGCSLVLVVCRPLCGPGLLKYLNPSLCSFKQICFPWLPASRLSRLTSASKTT